MRMQNILPYCFLAPAFTLLGLFVVVPMLQVAAFSCMRFSFFGPHEWAGVSNYARLLSDSLFWQTMANSMLCVLVTPVLMIVSLVLALSLRTTVRGAAPLRLLFFLPVITPMIVVGIIWKWIFTEETGILNYLVTTAGMQPVPWLSHYPTNLVSVMILTVWRGFGYYMMLFLAGLALIPRDIEEAAVLEGATPFQQTVHIVLPNLKPTLLFIAVLSSSSAIRIFTELYVLIPGAPMNNKTLVAYLYRQAFERFDFGYGSALAVVIFAVTFVFSYANIRLLERTE